MNVSFKILTEAELKTQGDKLEAGTIVFSDRGIYVAVKRGALVFYDGLSYGHYFNSIMKDSEPAIKYDGQLYFNTTSNKLFIESNKQWVNVSGDGGGATTPTLPTITINTLPDSVNQTYGE